MCKIDTFDTFHEFFLESCKEKNINDLQTNKKQKSSEKKIQPLANEIQNLQNLNNHHKDKSKSCLKIIRTLADGKNIDTAWLTSTIKRAKTNMMTKNSKNTTINDYVKNENEDTKERTIINHRNNVVRRTVR